MLLRTGLLIWKYSRPDVFLGGNNGSWLCADNTSGAQSVINIK